jgi:uncharacterized membrane protein
MTKQELIIAGILILIGIIAMILYFIKDEP